MFRKLIVLAGMLIATLCVSLDTKPAEAGRYWHRGGSYGWRGGWHPRYYYGGYYYRPHYYRPYYSYPYYGGYYYGPGVGVYYYW